MSASLASQNYHRELRVTRVPVAWQVAAAGDGHASSAASRTPDCRVFLRQRNKVSSLAVRYLGGGFAAGERKGDPLAGRGLEFRIGARRTGAVMTGSLPLTLAMFVVVFGLVPVIWGVQAIRDRLRDRYRWGDVEIWLEHQYLRLLHTRGSVVSPHDVETRTPATLRAGSLAGTCSPDRGATPYTAVPGAPASAGGPASPSPGLAGRQADGGSQRTPDLVWAVVSHRSAP